MTGAFLKGGHLDTDVHTRSGGEASMGQGTSKMARKSLEARGRAWNQFPSAPQKVPTCSQVWYSLNKRDLTFIRLRRLAKEEGVVRG